MSMSFYESVFIIRPEISSSDVDRITSEFVKIITDKEGVCIKSEYWGLRTLEYEIKNHKKGHYVFLGLNVSSAGLKEMERKMTLNEDIIRFMSINVDAISMEPSPILKGKTFENEEVVDVTSNKE